MTKPADSALNRANRPQLKRLSGTYVQYMEVTPVAGAFSCGRCTFVRNTTTSPACVNAEVQAPVSAKHGCCDLYYPARGKPVFNAPDVREKLR